jgi:hypothetical protein
MTRRVALVFLILLITFGFDGSSVCAESIAPKLEQAETLLRDSVETGDKKKLDDGAAIVLELISTKDVDQKYLADDVQTVAQLYQTSEQPEKSLEWWRKLLVLEPDNWRAWSKVVQCSQTLDKMSDRDEARLKVLALNKDGKVDQKMFCREQFRHGEYRAMVMELFTPDTKLGTELVFLFRKGSDDEKPDRRYTFGELKGDTQIARELKSIGPDDHLYSVDGFNAEGQWLVTMMKSKPTYEDLRKVVIGDLDKKPFSTGAGLKYPQAK